MALLFSFIIVLGLDQTQTAVIAQLAVRRPQDRWVVGSSPAEWHPKLLFFETPGSINKTVFIN